MSTYRKALLATLAAGLGALATGLQDDALSAAETVAALAAAVTAGGVVYRVPNSRPRRRRKAPTT